jgi:hypothetical protein
MSNFGLLDRRVGMQLAMVPLVLGVVANFIAARQSTIEWSGAAGLALVHRRRLPHRIR